MENDEMKVYIQILESENNILKERNDNLYKQNCGQAQIISKIMKDGGAYLYNVTVGNFKSTEVVYNRVMCNGSNTSLHSIHTSLI